MSQFDPVWNSLWNPVWGSLWDGGGGSGGNLFDGTYAFYPFSTNGDNTVTAGAKINERLSDKNFINDAGNLVTVGEYETAYTGSGELDEPSATNLMRNSELRSSDGVTPNFYTANTGGGNTIVQDEGLYSSITFETDNQRAFLNLRNVPVSSGELYTYSMYIEVIEPSGDILFRYLNINYPTLATSVTYKVDGVVSSTSTILTVGIHFVEVLFVPAASESVEMRFGLGGTGPTTGKAKFYTPQFELGGSATSIILNDIDAPATRDSDKAAVPTSDVYVDDEAFVADYNEGEFVSGVWLSAKYLTFIANGKYPNKVSQKWVGAILEAGNNTIIKVVSGISLNTFAYEIIKGTNAEIQAGFEYPNKFSIDFQYSSLTLAEVEQLRADVGDTPPTEYPDGSFKWLTWPSENVVFQVDFTIYSDLNNELCHLAWANAPKDTYVARTANALEFNHGNDELVVPYANLIEIGETYTGYVAIKPTELIGFADGFEVARMTRTDTQVAEWDSKCYMAGFNDTLAPVKLANLKVFDYVIAPPSASQLIVTDFSAQTDDPNSSGYASAAAVGGTEIGSLSPPVSIGGLPIEIIYSNNADLGNGVQKYVFMGDVNGALEGRVNATFNGVMYEFDSLFGAGSPPTIQSDALYDFLLANRDVPIVFSAEAALDFSDNGDFANNGDFDNG